MATATATPAPPAATTPAALGPVGSAPTHQGAPSGLELVALSDLRPHPLAERIPAMSPDERALLHEDIARRGILAPLEATREGVVLDGRHRLEAARALGLGEVPVRIVAPADEAAHILNAALARRHLTASQRAALAVECAEYQRTRQEGMARRRANLRQSSDVATLPHRPERSGEAAAARAGVSARTIQDAACVRDADPVLFDQVLAGRIPAHAAAQRVRRERRHGEIPPAPALPEGPFSVILADPPWQLGSPGSPFAPENHYPTMALDEIAALRVPGAEEAILYLWAVNMLLPEALGVMGAWGFTYRTNLAWVKPSIGPGVWARQRHELVLVGSRGGFPVPEGPDRPDSVIEAPRGRHSAKPPDLHERIERAHPQATKCELFARGTPRPGWAAWGNEVTPP